MTKLVLKMLKICKVIHSYKIRHAYVCTHCWLLLIYSKLSVIVPSGKVLEKGKENGLDANYQKCIFYTI